MKPQAAGPVFSLLTAYDRVDSSVGLPGGTRLGAGRGGVARPCIPIRDSRRMGHCGSRVDCARDISMVGNPFAIPGIEYALLAGAYSLVLSAVLLTPIGLVAAGREVSAIIGAWLGASRLGEGGMRRRMIAATGLAIGTGLLGFG